jgi:eukaryotic-like serine/threonine-protein kinase
MAQSAGTRLGPYEIVGPLGAGGMGEVYKARDTRLDRTVAIKVLPARFAADPQFRERFDREARAVAALNHPHICTLYDVGHQDGTDFLVMEYLEGETLATRLAHGALPLGQALRFAIEVADALDKAHRSGIFHRDLKPGNIMLLKSGAKLLDFGLAKARRPVVAGTGLSMLPTTRANLTAQGAILGTFQYMAPEQLEGREADTRTDIFAFGAVLYEMLTGRKAFAGATQASVIGAIMHADPPLLSTLQPLAPASLDRLVGRCLVKDPDERWQSVADLASELRWIEQTSSDATSQPAGVASATTLRQARLRARVHLVAAVLGALAIGSLASALYLRRAPADAPEMRVEIATPGADGFLAEFALSPDGRTLAFQAAADGKAQLWLRALDAEAARPLAGTEGGRRPFWSPDSRSIAFFANGQLKRIDVAGGPPVVLVSANGQGGTWSANGEILFAPQDTGPLYRVSARGGEAVAATRVDPPRITGHWHPFFLPDGRHFLFSGWGTPDQKGVYLGSLGSTNTQRLFAANSSVVFAPPDRVLYARQGALVEQRLDVKTWQPIGEPLPVAGAVAVDIDCGDCVAASTSATGLVAYRPTGPARQLVWVDRSGHETGRVGAPDTALRQAFQPSHDGRSLAFARAGEYLDIWLLDVASGVSQRFTFEAASKLYPVWSPDGRRIVYSWDRAGVLDLYVKAVDGAGNGTLLWSSSEPKGAYDWSADGRFILYASNSTKTGTDLWALPLTGDKTPVEVAHSAFNEYSGRFSPDGRLVVYYSNESGRPELYVQPFPGPGGKKQITSGGGFFLEWARDSRALIYGEPGNPPRRMAVPITLHGSVAEVGKPVAQESRPFGIMQSRDGQQVLQDKIVKPAAPVTVILNWKPR